MLLTLKVVSYQRLDPGQEATKVIDRCDASIGRADGNDWVLPDPDQILSRQHCVVRYRPGDGYYIEDTSANGVFVNDADQRVGNGRSQKLGDGDIVTLGKYEIQVNLTNDAAGQPVGAGSVDDMAPPSVQSGFTDLFEQPEAPPAGSPATPELDVGDPFADFSASDSEPLPEEPFLRQSSDDFIDGLELGDSPQSSDPIIPDDVDRLLDGLDLPEPEEPSEQRAGELGSAPAEREAFIPIAPAPSTPPAAPAKTVEPPPEAPEAPPLTPSREPVADRPPPVKSSPSPSPLPDESQAPPPSTPPQRSPPTQPQPVAPAVRADNAAVMAAFMAGAGLNPAQLQGVDPEELMKLIGQVFRQTVQGLMAVLMARRDIKAEIGARDVTTIKSTENNPLKFSLSVDDAMITLLTKRGASYMPPLQALQQGFDDIKAHELAMMAGMQAALTHLLNRFDPRALENELGERSLLENILAGSRKARYWDLFNKLYADIAREAEEDFRDLFGKEFVRAYEEQSRKI